MSIRRRKKTQAFTQINNAALRNPVLSLKAKGLLAVMMSCPEDWQFYMDWLQKQSKDGREAHQNAMKELEHHRYVVRLRAQGKDGTFKGWEYLVDDEPITDITPGGTVISEENDEEPSSESSQKPTNGKPVNRLAADERETRLTGNPTDGKPATTNNVLTNTDLNKNVVASNVTENAHATPPQRDDDFSDLEDSDQAQLEAEAAFDVQVAELPGINPTSANLNQPVQDDDWQGEPKNSDDTGFENVPPAASAPLAPWSAAEVDARLDQLCNGRWLKPYVQRGREGQQPALIDEVDATGVDRHDIAQRVSPELLEETVASVRTERARLQADAAFDNSIKVFSAQHMLIQALQARVLASYNIQRLVREATTEEPAEVPAAPRPVAGGRAWEIGDEVSYRRDRYRIVDITDRKIILDSDENGSVDIIRASSELQALRLVSAADVAKASA